MKEAIDEKEDEFTGLTPTVEEFDPTIIPFQQNVINDIFAKLDFNLGVHELLLSGSVGSAKTLLMAHIAVILCLMFPRNRIILCRKTLPALKSTLLQVVVEHLGLNVKYKFNQSSGKLVFVDNRSEIICHSWADKKVMKIRSVNASCAMIEELTENDNMDFYKEILMRCNRIPHIPINFMMCATNPGAPSHPAYKYFFLKPSKTKKIYFSLTEQNPFLKKSYIKKLKETLSKKEADRMLRGMWVELITDAIYYAYNPLKNFISKPYFIRSDVPIDLMHDFNIGKGKPMSAAVGQYIDGKFHVWKVFAKEGFKTANILDEMDALGVFRYSGSLYRVFGDASGKNNDTRSTVTDYDIIEKFLSKKGLRYEMHVPKSNPPIRRRQNIVNAMFENDNGDAKFFQYAGTEWLDEGWKLTVFKSGGHLVEDDSIPQQHVTTAVGYWIDMILNRDSGESETIIT